MDLKKFCLLISVAAVISLVCYPPSVTAGDIVHDDDSSPKKPGCENDFILVELLMLLFLPIPVIFFYDFLTGSCLFCLLVEFWFC